MNMTAEKRSTAFVRKLRVGDKFVDYDGSRWEVSRTPIVKEDKVHIGLLQVPPRPGVNRYTRAFIYDADHRVKIVRR